jgi:hypothetical protein
MTNRISDQWPESSRFTLGPLPEKALKKPAGFDAIVLDFPLRDELRRVEDDIRRILWAEAQKRKDDDPDIEESLLEMEQISHEFEITAAAREDETVEESVRNDPDHAMERTKLVHAVGTIPEVRAVLEPMFDERSALRKKLKKIKAFRDNVHLN